MADDLGHREIADDLRARILAGEFLPGNRIGTEKVLAYEYRVGLWTIGAAIDLLRREGYIEPWRRGMGAVVRERPPVREVVHRHGSQVSARPATADDAERASDETIVPGVWLLVVQSGDDVFLYRADSTTIRFY